MSAAPVPAPVTPAPLRPILSFLGNLLNSPMFQQILQTLIAALLIPKSSNPSAVSARVRSRKRRSPNWLESCRGAPATRSSVARTPSTACVSDPPGRDTDSIRLPATPAAEHLTGSGLPSRQASFLSPKS